MGPSVLWVLVLGFLAGVFIRSLLPLGLSFAGFISLLAAAVLVVGFLERSKLHVGMLVALALFACASGVARMDFALLVSDRALDGYLGSEIVLEGVVFGEPD